jgi:hypothetical protein
MLPFFSNDKGGLPTRIVVNLVFVGEGTVYLKPGKLLQYHSAKELERRLDIPIRLPQNGDSWWKGQQYPWYIVLEGILGGIGGGLIGILGGVGRARRLVLTLIAVFIALGVVNLIAGLIALALRQPHEVCHPLLFAGIFLVAFGPWTFTAARRRYEQIELRKMAAMDSR